MINIWKTMIWMCHHKQYTFHLFIQNKYLIIPLPKLCSFYNNILETVFSNSTVNRIYYVSFKLEFESIIHRVLQWRKSEGNIWKCNASHIFPKTTYAQFELPSFYYKIVFHAFYPRGSLDVKIEILNKGQRKLHTCITCKRSYALRIHSNVFESI